jgi:hypothetical protein
LLVFSFGIHAQEDGSEAPPPLSDVWVMVAKPGMDEEFSAAVARHLQFRKDAGESREWNGFRVVAGHNMERVAFRACCFSWADLDEHTAQGAELGLVEHFSANVAQYVDHMHHYLEAADWENSHWPDEGTSGPYYGVTTWKVKQGSGPASGAAKKKFSELALTEGWADDDNNWIWFSRQVGAASVSLVSSFESFADMAPPEQSFYEFVVENLGEAETDALFADFSGGFDDSDYTIWRLDPSISTPQQEDDD